MFYIGGGNIRCLADYEVPFNDRKFRNRRGLATSPNRRHQEIFACSRIISQKPA